MILELELEKIEQKEINELKALKEKILIMALRMKRMKKGCNGGI